MRGGAAQRTTTGRSPRCGGSRSCSSAAVRSTFKVKAFRSAAATVLPLPADEVADRVEDGTLTDLPGIGAEHGRR